MPHAETKKAPAEFFVQESTIIIPDKPKTWRSAPKFQSFQLGDFIMRKKPYQPAGQRDKLAPKFEGPLRIIQVDPNGITYRAQWAHGSRKPVSLHQSQIKKFHGEMPLAHGTREAQPPPMQAKSTGSLPIARPSPVAQEHSAGLDLAKLRSIPVAFNNVHLHDISSPSHHTGDSLVLQSLDQDGDARMASVPSQQAGNGSGGQPLSSPSHHTGDSSNRQRQNMELESGFDLPSEHAGNSSNGQSSNANMDIEPTGSSPSHHAVDSSGGYVPSSDADEQGNTPSELAGGNLVPSPLPSANGLTNPSADGRVMDIARDRLGPRIPINWDQTIADQSVEGNDISDGYRGNSLDEGVLSDGCMPVAQAAQPESPNDFAGFSSDEDIPHVAASTPKTRFCLRNFKPPKNIEPIEAPQDSSSGLATRAAQAVLADQGPSDVRGEELLDDFELDVEGIMLHSDMISSGDAGNLTRDLELLKVYCSLGIVEHPHIEELPDDSCCGSVGCFRCCKLS